MSAQLKENLLWLLTLPFSIAIIAAAAGVFFQRRWGQPDPIKLKLKYADRLAQLKAEVSYFDRINADLGAYTFKQLRQFVSLFIFICLVVTFQYLGLILTMVLVPFAVKDATMQPLTGADLFTLLSLSAAMPMIGFAFLSWAGIDAAIRLRQAARFEKHKKPKMLREIELLEKEDR